jgi:hypothetical protein
MPLQLTEEEPTTAATIVRPQRRRCIGVEKEATVAATCEKGAYEASLTSQILVVHQPNTCPNPCQPWGRVLVDGC